MSRPYTHRGHNGFAFLGNRMHPEDVHWVNAQMAGLVESPPAKVYRPAARPKRRGYRIEHSSTVLDRLRGQPELLAGMAQLAIRSVLPGARSPESRNGLDETVRDRHLELLQALGEAGVEAAA